MTTAAELISRTRNDYLTPSSAETRNKLSGAVVAGDETLTFARPLNGLASGSKLSIDLEDIHVWSTDDSAMTADVDRGEYATTAAAHADGHVVLVNPRYTNAQILRALNAAAASLVSEGIFGVTTVELTYVSGVGGYDLTDSTKVLDLLDVHHESADASTKQWLRVPNVRLLPDANVADFASGTGVLIDTVVPNGTTLRVAYAHELSSALSALTDVVETVIGIDAVAVDILCIGAALHLTAGKEIALNETDVARPRRSSEVPPGAFSQADSNLRSLWRDRVKAERSRLNRKHKRNKVREFSR